MRKRKKKKSRAAAVITALIILFIGAMTAYKMPEISKELVYPEKFSEYVVKYSELYGLDRYFVYAVIKTESNFDPNAESEVGARGLMQVMEDSYDWVKFRMGENADDSVYDDMYDPEINIKYGAYLLKLLYEEYGSKETAAAAYHTGRGNVNSWLEDKSYSSDGITLDSMPSSVTSHYVYKVMNAYEGYINLYCG